MWRVVLCAALAFGADWKTAPFPGWSDHTVLRLLTDSPWARPRTVKFTWMQRNEQPITYKDIPGAQAPGPSTNTGGPLGGIGPAKSKLPDRANLVFRWASALPLRQAKALYRQRDEKRPALVEPRPSGHVLEIFGLPAIVAHRGAGSLELILKQTAYLKTGGGRTIRPDRVEVAIHALTLTVKIHFPASAAITPADHELECYGDLQIFHFKERFQLKSMIYENSLEL